ncbi:MAG: DUF2189 domain-containing protein [Rhodospirillales bacterium]|nr:DUF2189 domain-containing protein [Rhodospirillales bacterium]
MTASLSGNYQLPVRIRSIKDVDRSGHWLSEGWRDFTLAPRVSLIYGGAFVVAGLLIAIVLFTRGLGSLILPLAGGLMILAPIMVVGLYDVSRRLEAGLPVSLRDCFRAFGRSVGQLSVLGVVLMVAYLFWVMTALLLFMLFFNQSPPQFDQFFQDVVLSPPGIALLLFGGAIGAVFAWVAFAVTAVSIPLIYDRPVDAMTAIGVSLITVRENFRVMFGWGALIAVATAVAIATAFIGLAVVLPVVAYATWHAYRDLIAGGPVYPEDAVSPPAFRSGGDKTGAMDASG